MKDFAIGKKGILRVGTEIGGKPIRMQMSQNRDGFTIERYTKIGGVWILENRKLVRLGDGKFSITNTRKVA